MLAFGTVFLQGYFYTETNPGALWQAPVAALALTAFLLLWCWWNINDPRTQTGYVPYDTLVRFNPELRMTDEPVKTFWSIDKYGNKREYKAHKIPQGPGNTITQYKEKGETGDTEKRWSAANVEAIIIEHGGQTYRFEPRKDEDYDYFVSPEGWFMMQYDTGVTGLPRMFSFWLLCANMFLNLFHLALWFVCLWLLLRFEWAHALGLALAFWLVVTLFVLPPLFAQVAAVAGQTAAGS
jgi:hypothetical protein